MRSFLAAILLIGVGMVLTACQTLNKDECIAADWRIIGEQDGSEGRNPQKRFGAHVKACERARITPDQALWSQGYQDGLVSFCTPNRGLGHGQAGNIYHNVCPPQSEPGFLSGYRLGLEESQKKAEIKNLESRIRSAEFEIDAVGQSIRRGKIGEIEGRRAIRRKRQDIRDYSRELGRAEVDLGAIQRRIELFRQDISSNRLVAN